VLSFNLASWQPRYPPQCWWTWVMVGHLVLDFYCLKIMTNINNHTTSRWQNHRFTLHGSEKTFILRVYSKKWPFDLAYAFLKFNFKITPFIFAGVVHGLLTKDHHTHQECFTPCMKYVCVGRTTFFFSKGRLCPSLCINWCICLCLEK
jgi:hypothetical protein